MDDPTRCRSVRACGHRASVPASRLVRPTGRQRHPPRHRHAARSVTAPAPSSGRAGQSPSAISRLARRVRETLTRWFVGVPPQPAPLPIVGLPLWAQVGKRRRAHIRRVAAVLKQWADAMKISGRERQRWLRSCWLHDALRDASLPAGKTHGEAAADRAAEDGESDPGVLDAVRYHSVGYAGWDDVGKMLYLADYLEPGRRTRRRQRAAWAKRVPRERDAVLREIVAREVRWRMRRGKPVDVHTVEFWNSLTEH